MFAAISHTGIVQPSGPSNHCFMRSASLCARQTWSSEPPHRAVTTEAMIGMDFPGTLNELTLTAVEGGTLLSLVITYANAEMRDAVLATGMTGGMETSYARLEGLLGAGVRA